MAKASDFGGFITGENSWEIFFLFSFGFLITLTREIRLDIGDIFTDRKANLKTVPITFGIEKAYVFAVTILVILVAYSYLPMLLGVYSKNYGILVTALNLFSFIIALAMVKRKGPSLQKFGLKISMFLYPLVVTISQIFL